LCSRHYTILHGGGKRSKTAHDTSPDSKKERSPPRTSKKTSASGAAVRKVTAPAASVAKVNPFGEARSPRLSALVAALKSAQPIACGALTSAKVGAVEAGPSCAKSTTLRARFASLLPIDVAALVALMAHGTKTPADTRVLDEVTAVHRLLTLSAGTRGVKFENALDGLAKFHQLQAQPACAIDTTALTFLAGAASSYEPLPIVDMSD
jgi:hypothetical protein